MNTLEALRNIKREKPTFFSTLYDSDMWDEDIETIEKSLKALEIIKKLFEANVLGVLETHDNKYFLRVFNRVYEINKEEYDLWKEVLL